MDFDRLKPRSARELAASLVLGVLLLVSQALAGSQLEGWRYERAAIRSGEGWRLVTAHLVHYDATHLAWNLLGLGLVAWLFAREYGTRGWLVILAASTAAVDLGFLVFEPRLQWYVGFSGVLHGLMAAGLLAWLLRGPDVLTLLVAALFVAKLGWEHFAGALPFTAGTLGLPVIHQAHTYGAIGGLLAGAALCWRRQRQDVAPSL
jgi:rhomboid family GlyGly-CTERM serine protease